MLQKRFGHIIALGEPYGQFPETIETRFRNAIVERNDNLCNRVKELFENLIREFDELYSDHGNDVTDPKELEFMDRILLYVQEANRKLDGPITNNFAQSQSASSMTSQPRMKRERSPDGDS